MKKLKHFKFKIYRRFQSEIWGNLMLVRRKNNVLRMVIRNFRYLRYVFMIKRKWNYASSYYMNTSRLKKQLYFLKQSSNNKKINKLSNIHNSFWSKFTNFYKKIDLNKLILNLQENDLHNKKKNINDCFSWLSYVDWRTYKFRCKLYKKFNLYRKFNNKSKRYKLNRNNIFSHIAHDYIHRSKSYYVKKKLPFWIEMKLEREKMSLFFGLINKRKYIKAQTKAFNGMKLRSDAILRLLGQLNFFLFTINLHMNMYFIRNIIRSNHILVNDKIRNNPFFFIKMFDDVSIIKNKVYFYYKAMKFRFKNKLILRNMPEYIEFNYHIMTGSVWKAPLLGDIIGPHDYPFSNLSFDWLRYSKSSALPRRRIYK